PLRDEVGEREADLERRTETRDPDRSGHQPEAPAPERVVEHPTEIAVVLDGGTAREVDHRRHDDHCCGDQRSEPMPSEAVIRFAPTSSSLHSSSTAPDE